MPIAFSTKQDNTSRRLWKMLENQEVRDGMSRADAKHDCKQVRKMFRYGGLVVNDINGRAVYVPPGKHITQYGTGVKLYAEQLLVDLSQHTIVPFSEHLAETKYSDSINQHTNKVLFERLCGVENAN